MKKMNSKKGFTLMEMLIVVAIIAILVAIAIPTMSTSLNKSKIAADAANIRSGYASLTAALLDKTADVPESGTKTYYLTDQGSYSDGSTGAYKCQGNATSTDGVDVAGLISDWNKGEIVSYTVNTDGAITAIDTTAAS